MGPLIPQQCWPSVSVGPVSNNAYPVVAQSPLPIKNPDANPYVDYVAAWQVMKAPLSDYLAGFCAGYALLTGGASPDVAVAKAAGLIQAARIAHGSAAYGDGTMDVWRLFVENPLDVDAVIARVGH